MQIAHLILAHKNPHQTNRLIKALHHLDASIFVHLDKKTRDYEFRLLELEPRVTFIPKRVDITWAGFGTIQAILNGLQFIVDYNQFEYINVISAQDFPLENSGLFNEFLKKNRGKEFITCDPIYTSWKEAIDRVEKYYLINYKFIGKYKIEKLINILLPRRVFPLQYTLAGRSNWFTITNGACQYILDTIKKYPEIIQFFKYSWGADEIIFSSILYNSHFKNQIENNLVFTDWSIEMKGHPKILKQSDIQNLINSRKFFARKFDINVDEGVINYLEEKIKRL